MCIKSVTNNCFLPSMNHSFLPLTTHGSCITCKIGIYVCSQCSYELFSSQSKFEHHSPWPAFTETIHEDSVVKEVEPLDDGDTTCYKVKCGKCGNSLGHEFLKDGPKQKSRF